MMIFRNYSKERARYVLKHTVLDERIMRIPSILGRDMLNKHALTYDKRHEMAYITDESLRYICCFQEDLSEILKLSL